MRRGKADGSRSQSKSSILSKTISTTEDPATSIAKIQIGNFLENVYQVQVIKVEVNVFSPIVKSKRKVQKLI